MLILHYWSFVNTFPSLDFENFVSLCPIRASAQDTIFVENRIEFIWRTIQILPPGNVAFSKHFKTYFRQKKYKKHVKMTDTVVNADVAPLASASPAAKKSKTAMPIAKKPRVKPAHPPTAEMVYNAIRILKERSGSSLQAIKKYVSTTYKIDAEKLAPFIKKYLRNAVASGQIVQTKGKGASGSFKLANREVVKKAPKETKPKAPKAKAVVLEKKSKSTKATDAAKKKPAAAKTTKVTAKKAASAAADKKKPASLKAKAKTATKVSKSPKQKPTKATKVAAKKPKTPKPKKVAPTKAVVAPKKSTAAKKK